MIFQSAITGTSAFVSCRLSRHSRGLTLLEMLLAITIFAVVIGTIYASLDAGNKVLVAGRETMGRYQNARAGMSRILKDLRRSLSPASFPYEEEEEEYTEEELEDLLFFEEEDENPMQIRFRGDRSSVEFTIRELTGPDDPLPMDIREVKYRVTRGALVRETIRSLLLARMFDLAEKRRCQHQDCSDEDLDYRSPEQQGYFENPTPRVICDGVEDVVFSYSDGVEWFESWDSEEVVLSDYSTDLPEDDITEMDEEILGLPQMVEVQLQVQGNVSLTSVTAIPGADLNLIGYRSNESDFSTAFRKGLDRRDRLRLNQYDRGNYR